MESEPQTSQPGSRTQPLLKLVAGALAIAVAAYLLGWLPTDRKLRRANTSLQAAELDLRLSNLHRRLGVASHQASQGNYAETGIAAMQFFEGCSALAGSDALDQWPRTRTAIAAYADYRDELLALIAAADPTVHQRLASLYLTMDGVLQRRE